MNNDLENIPLGVILAWASLLALYFVAPHHGTHFVVHSVCAAGFAVSRLLHTIVYLKKTTYIRPLVFFASLLFLIGVVANVGRFVFTASALTAHH